MSVRRRKGLPAVSTLGTVYSGLVLIFLLAPLMVVFPVSFTAGSIATFPPSGFSLRWYVDFFSDHYWMRAVKLSFALGVFVALVSTAIGLVTALAMSRYLANRSGRVFRAIVLLPLIIPHIVSAVALFSILSRFGLVSTFWGLAIAHIVLAMPYSVLVIENGLARLDRSLEEAARSLGASRLQVMRLVTIPLILPSIIGSLVFAFVLSFDEVIVVLFVGGASFQTLPARMFVFLETELQPTPAVISALLIFALIAARLAAQFFAKRRPWTRAAGV